MTNLKHFVSYYTNELTPFINSIDAAICVRITHSNTKICFNSIHREILYAIDACFKERGYKNSIFHENIFGKALLFPIQSLSTNVPFDNFMKYYKNYFMKRLTLIEQYFESMNHNYEDCLKEKKELLNTYAVVFGIHCLPPEICRIIQSYLLADIQQFVRVRMLYEEKRKYINN